MTDSCGNFCGACGGPPPPPPPPSTCRPHCGGCNAPCGGGTRICTYSDCSTDEIDCNTQPCCTDSSWSCATPYNGSEVSNCGHIVNPATHNNCSPRFITAGGASVYSGGSITGLYDSNYPAAFPYFNPSTYGVVSSGGDISLSTAKINGKGWKITSYGLQQTRFDHDYFWSRLKDKVTTTLNVNSITSGDLQASGTAPVIFAIHPVSGNTVTFNTPINISGGKFLVVFVNSTADTPVNLTVGDKVTVQNGSFILWIVSGNVNIDSTVSNADGYYVLTGSYSDGTGSVQLNDSGGVAAYGGINLGRINSNTNLPSETFTFDPNIQRLSGLIGESTFNWNEIVP